LGAEARALLWASSLIVGAALLLLASRIRRVASAARETGVSVERTIRLAQMVGIVAIFVTVIASVVDLPPTARAAQWLSLVAVGGVLMYIVTRLRAQAAMLNDVDDMKSRFVALTNHELRTPVAVLHSVLETLEEDLAGKLSIQQAAFLRAACTSSRELAERVDMLTQLHRFDTGVEADGKRLPFGDVYEDVVREMGRTRQGVSLRATMSDQAEILPVPSADTAVVLRQLLTNAVKFSPVGGDVEIRAQFVGGDLVWEIADHGPGVPLAQRSAIFEAFYQPGDLLRRDSGGMGVGLNLARMACRRMGATITVANRPGGGACFTVRMPLPIEEPLAFPVPSHGRASRPTGALG
jgi:signal transduction histidine kinase